MACEPRYKLSRNLSLVEGENSQLSLRREEMEAASPEAASQVQADGYFKYRLMRGPNAEQLCHGYLDFKSLNALLASPATSSPPNVSVSSSPCQPGSATYRFELLSGISDLREGALRLPPAHRLSIGALPSPDSVRPEPQCALPSTFCECSLSLRFDLNVAP